jgi:hypothetical protein
MLAESFGILPGGERLRLVRPLHQDLGDGRCALAYKAVLENLEWYLHLRVRDRECLLYLDVISDHFLELGHMDNWMDLASLR